MSNQHYITRKLKISNDVLNDMGRMKNYANQFAYDYIIDNGYSNYEINDIYIDFSMKHVRFGIIIFK